jgi:four helix bundle protein
MNTRNRDLAVRTGRFALDIIRPCSTLPKSIVAQALGRQILGCGTPVGAQYREADRAKSNADFISKIEGALQELDETAYWRELMSESGAGPVAETAKTAAEVQELIAIFVTVNRSKDSETKALKGLLSSLILPPSSLHVLA